MGGNRHHSRSPGVYAQRNHYHSVRPGGYYPVGDTLIGYSKDIEKVPEGPKQLTPDDLKARVKKLNLVVNVPTPLSDLEKENLVTAELAAKQIS